MPDTEPTPDDNHRATTRLPALTLPPATTSPGDDLPGSDDTPVQAGMPGASSVGTSGFRRVSIGRLGRPAGASSGMRHMRVRLTLWLLWIDMAAIAALAWLTPVGDHAAEGHDAGWAALAALAGSIVLGTAFAGGYRWQSLVRSSHASLAAIGAVLGAALGTVLFKLLLAYGSEQAVVAHVSPRSLLAPLAAGAWVLATRAVARILIRRWVSRQSIIAIGAPEQLEQVRTLLARHSLDGLLQTIDESVPRPALRLEELLENGFGVHAIVLARPRTEMAVSLRLGLVHARLDGFRIIEQADLVEEIEERVPMQTVDSWWLIVLEGLPAVSAPFYLAFKRCFDLLLSIPAFILLLPVMLLTAIAVVATSRGGALFRQTRQGLRGREFTIYKFRTMRTDAEAAGARWATKNDPRVTSIGAFLRRSRLDELPQLWNVIRGDMSLIGPRPERPEFNRMLAERIPWYDLRHLARPGLSGWAQVRYPYGASVEDALAKLEYDVYYLRHASPGFDFRIMLLTVAVVLGLRGR